MYAADTTHKVESTNKPTIWQNDVLMGTIADAGCYFNHHRPLRSRAIRCRAVAASAASLFNARHATIISQQSINFLRHCRCFCCSNFRRLRYFTV
eukprot:scaffold57465_cov98-Cyclotella_meneghiniana.AAC.4